MLKLGNNYVPNLTWIPEQNASLQTGNLLTGEARGNTGEIPLVMHSYTVVCTAILEAPWTPKSVSLF